MKEKWYKHVLTHIKGFFRSLQLKQALKSAYEKLAPVGTWRYRITRGLILSLRRRVRLSDIHYRRWVACCDNPSEADLQHEQEKLSALSHSPIISVLMPVYNPPLGFLEEAIQSVRNQVYPHWELCIADDASTQPGVQALIQSHVESDPRIKAVFREQNGHISAASNSALELAGGEFIALLDHDDRLHPLALSTVVQAINANPQCKVVYSDEDKLTATGVRIDPYFKSDFDYDLLLCQNMVSHLGVYQTAIVRKVGGFRVGYEGSQDYDLLLRVLDGIDPAQIIHIPKVLYHWRISEHSVATNIDMKPYALAAGERALSDHLNRRQVQAGVEPFRKFGYKINYSWRAPLPSTELFVRISNLTKELIEDWGARISQCDASEFKVSFLLGTLESTDPWTSSQIEDPQMRIIHDKSTRADAVKLNALIKGSSADVIGLMDADCWQFSSGWLEHLLAVLLQEGVGAVAPKLIYPNGLIYSCGLILGVDGLAKRLFNGVSNADPSYYFGWASLNKGYSALPSEFILFKRADFLIVKGLDRDLEPPSARMIDFCLQLRSCGLRTILVPDVIVTVQGVSNSGDGHTHDDVVQNPSDSALLRRKWEKWIDNDPAFNPNLTLHQSKPIVKAPPW